MTRSLWIINNDLWITFAFHIRIVYLGFQPWETDFDHTIVWFKISKLKKAALESPKIFFFIFWYFTPTKMYGRNRGLLEVPGTLIIKIVLPMVLWVYKRNSTRSILVIDQDGLTLPGPRYYLNAPTNIDAFENNPDAVTRQYRDLIQSVITLLGGRLDNDAVKDILLFERRLAMITIPSYDQRRRSKQYVNKIGKIQDLKKLLPQIDWQQVRKRVACL